MATKLYLKSVISRDTPYKSSTFHKKHTWSKFCGRRSLEVHQGWNTHTLWYKWTIVHGNRNTCHRWMFLWCKAMLFSRSSLLLPCLLSRNSSSSPLLSIWYDLPGGEDEMSCSPALTFSLAWRDEVKELDLGLWPELKLSEFRDSTCLPPALIPGTSSKLSCSEATSSSCGWSFLGLQSTFYAGHISVCPKESQL